MNHDYTLLPSNDQEPLNNIQLNDTFSYQKYPINPSNDSYTIHILQSYHSSSSSLHPNNHISTSKYTWYNVLPKILYEQFTKMVNIYYLIIAILQSIREISYSGGVPVIILPLTFVTMINGLKDYFEDLKRKHSDDKENSQIVDVYDITINKFKSTKWKDLRLGDVVRVNNTEAFPADLLLLKSSNDNGICYIETKNIDGETNLKYRYANKELSRLCLGKNITINDYVKKLQGIKIIANPPNDLLYQFEGKVYVKPNNNTNNSSNEINVNQDSLLLRGCYLRHTDYIIATTIYLGHHTKCMMNSPKARSKTSKVEDIMNHQILLILILQITLSLIATSINFIWYYYSLPSLQSYIYLPDTIEYIDHLTLRIFLTRAGTWILIFTNFVPISLLVTMEVIKFIQGMFIQWDIDMIDINRNVAAKVQTSTLNEELGQVSYIFSDKTGTLTKNCMKYKKMIIGNVVYGEGNSNSNSCYWKNKDKVESSRTCDKYGEIKKSAYIDYDMKFKDDCNNSQGSNYNTIKHFMNCLTLCHSVVYDYEQWRQNRLLVYNSSSPDEMALLEFSRQFDYIFKERTVDQKILLEIKGEIISYDIISILSYSSERRRMSIIIKSPQPDGKYYLYIKGDDSIIQAKLKENPSQGYNALINKTLTSFALEGLRTLAIAYREITEEEIKSITKRLSNITSVSTLHSSLQIIPNDNIDKLYNDIENNLILLGITGIEDQLQDNVYNTLQSLSQSGIKIWMLTGDKRETAMTIGYSCGLINSTQHIISIPDNTSLEVLYTELSKVNNLFDSDPNANVSIVLSTKELNCIFSINHNDNNSNEDIINLFSTVAIKCKSMIFSRITPKQKGQLVSLIKNNLQGKGTTLAIGDGANDVLMLSTADIGIGINGVEGSEAARASDYSIAEFSYLKKLLFVHGRESYRKNTFVVCYNFYKNALFVMPQFWMGMISYFSGQVLFDRWIYQFFNTIYACLPIIWYGIYDTEISRKVLLIDPFYYKQGIDRRLFHSGRFWKWIFFGAAQGLIIFLFAFYTFKLQGADGKMQDLWSIGTMAYSGIVLIANIKIIQYTTSQTWVSAIIVIASIAMYYLSVYIMSMYPYFYIFDNWRMIMMDIRFYYGSIGMIVLTFAVDIGIGRIILYYSGLPSMRKENVDIGSGSTEEINYGYRKEVKMEMTGDMRIGIDDQKEYEERLV